MKWKLFNLIFTTVLSITVLGLLIYVGYAWYIDSSRVSGTNISFSTQDGADVGYEVTILGNDGRIISAPVIPDEVTMLKIDLKDTSAKSLKITMTPKLTFKEVIRDGNTNLITSVKTVTDDPTGVNNSITTITDISKYYLVDEYYTYDSSTGLKGSKVYNLTDEDKQEIFTSFYEQYTYNLINKLKYYASDTLYTSDEYVEAFYENGNIKDIFQDVSGGVTFTVDITQQEALYEGIKYIYLYFDPTDEVFPYAGENNALANYCFFGQNPYFYQSVKFDVLTVANED